MARRLRDQDGNIVAIELTLDEMARTLAIVPEDLELWSTLLPAYSPGIYRVATVSELNTWKKRAAILRTRMSQEAVAKVEQAGLLDAYAGLAEDCPHGIPAHVWRSYGVIVLMQVRYGKKIDAKELAERANLTEVDPATGKLRPSVTLAEKHIRLLTGLKKLTETPERWEHLGLPKSWVSA